MRYYSGKIPSLQRRAARLPLVLAPLEKNRKVNIAPSEERSQLAQARFRRRIEVNCLESTRLKCLILYHYFSATYYSFHTLKYSTLLLISNSLILKFSLNSGCHHRALLSPRCPQDGTKSWRKGWHLLFIPPTSNPHRIPRGHLSPSWACPSPA